MNQFPGDGFPSFDTFEILLQFDEVLQEDHPLQDYAKTNFNDGLNFLGDQSTRASLPERPSHVSNTFTSVISTTQCRDKAWNFPENPVVLMNLAGRIPPLAIQHNDPAISLRDQQSNLSLRSVRRQRRAKTRIMADRMKLSCPYRAAEAELNISLHMCTGLQVPLRSDVRRHLIRPLRRNSPTGAMERFVFEGEE
jgi:hypothetical protein